MEIGICMAPPSTELAEALSSAGCDYYEPAVASSVMAAGNGAFEADLGSWTVGPLSPRSANVLLPGELKVVGERVDTAAVAAYLTEAGRRAGLLGLGVLVFGSGAARRAPDGFPAGEARRQFGEALRLAVEHAAPGTTIAAEHLRRAETNVVNSLAEAAALVRDVGVAGLGLVVDGYHLDEEAEDVGVVRDVAPLVRHVHVCGPGRRPPGPGDEGYLAPLLRALADIGYTGRCSIECHWADLAGEGPPAVRTVRRAADLAGLA
jgi:sugar phosphate isomerase/epimerase